MFSFRKSICVLIVLILACVMIPSTVNAFRVTRVEYYIDTDPGYGSGNSVGIVSDTSINVSFVANLNGLSVGYHTLYVRVQDDSNRWSLTSMKPFLVEPIPGNTVRIAAAEYFIDSDPGYGLGRVISVSTDSTISANFIADLSGIAIGYHSLSIRVKDNRGRWSLVIVKPFLVEPLRLNGTVAAAEYFVDSDPGYGNGHAISFTPESEISTNFTVDLSTVPVGYHALSVRTRDNNGKWSLTLVKPFLVEPIPVNPLLSAVEYFIDSDPGLGNGRPIAITMGSTINANFTADLSGLSLGFHALYIRSRDNSGKWSLPIVKPFLVEPAPSTSGQILAAEYFIDTDPGIGSGHGIVITPGSSIESGFVADLRSTTPGNHQLYVRVRDNQGKWSLYYLHEFAVVISPDPPTMLVITYANGSATLSWTYGGYADGFKIYRSETSGYFSPPLEGTYLAMVGPSNFTYTDNNVTGKYYYRVVTYRNGD